MSFILQTAAKVGCDLSHRVVPRSAGGVSEPPAEATKLPTGISDFAEALAKAGRLPNRMVVSPKTYSRLEAAIDRSTRSAENLARLHDPKTIVFRQPNGVYLAKDERDLTAQEWAWAGRYEITERYSSTRTSMVRTPAGSYRMSDEFLALVPPPRNEV